MGKFVQIFEILDIKENDWEEPEWKKHFSQGIHCFQRKDFEKAKLLFEKVLSLKPQDGPSQFYLQKITEFSAIDLPQDWSGEIEILEK